LASVFVSYARADRDIVAQLADSLETLGHSTWWDRRIKGGDDFSANIERELEAANVVVVAWSATGCQSNWVKDEAQFGADQGKLVAISLDGSMPPLGFRQFHSIDFSRWPGSKSCFEELASSIAARLDPNAAPTASTSSAALVRNSVETWQDKIPWIAVLPVKFRGEDPDLLDLADDLADSFASAMSRFSYLKVARMPSLAESKRAGAHYLLDATLRKSGSNVRLSVRLSTTDDDRQVWGNHFNRSFDPDLLFELNDDLTDHVVIAVADPYGALMRDLSAPILELQPENMTPYQALVRGFAYRLRVTEEDHKISARALELAVQAAPGDADVVAGLAFMYLEEHKNRYNEQPGASEKALRYALRAVEIDPQSGYAYYALADTSFFNMDTHGFKTATLRSIELNPWDTDALAMLGIYTMFSGDWDSGRKMVDRAIELNPNAPGWYWFGGCWYHYFRKEFDLALTFARRANMPQYHAYHGFLAIVLADMGRIDEARENFERWLALFPGGLAGYAGNLDRWFYCQPELSQRVRHSFRIAGFELPE
jgi:TolB-like protein/Flp pilus assembly protein TadD